MRTFDGPRAGSRAYQALEKLYALGGTVNFPDWVKAAGWSGSASEFDRTVVGALTRGRHIFKGGNHYTITDVGIAHIGQVDRVEPSQAIIAPPTYVAPVQVLSARYRLGLALMREGAFDYRNIPSLLGAERVAYRSSLNVVGAGLAAQEGGCR